ncbi:alkaline phosphatase [Parabacteroides sp. PF5-9]|uniref:alkaline phosphatase n=1 Tax=Parabacteroides sp. PF5-9 TaxID=1742404 RepID=UPI002476BFF9|nr:alkaline phosphatase [Parabacteroides sp. PF5-9]MDH6359158.1 alkaline phosphatase [Parabacteroides sp. PF5-9]
MKKTNSLLLLLVIALALGLAYVLIPKKGSVAGEVKPVKNLIVLIPDGTSLPVVSIARWAQWYSDPSKPDLAIDPYLCGTVTTFSSNAPIGDSAPTTSCYMTGYPSRTGHVSTYPEADGANDIYPMDPSRAYQPLTTVLEAAKIVQNKATGLVFTCEFPHATPADCSAHSYNRSKYDWIAPQMAHNNIDVVIGGGVSLLPQESEDYLLANGYTLYKDNLQGMRSDSNSKMWALYGSRAMDYDLDRDPNEQPSIEEMTRTAIEKLAKNPNGFFLMVEGSKVDWAAHANDPVGMVSDFLAFDRACQAAFEFARQNGETAVVVLPDHGNSGISLGKYECTGYDKLTKEQLFHPFSQFKLTAEGFAKMVNSKPYSEVQDIFRTYAGFELSKEELAALNHCKDYANSPVPVEKRSSEGIAPSLYSGSLTSFMAKLMTSKTCFGFTTGGHTGEEVFLAAYHPDNNSLPIGRRTNIELNHYLCAVLGLTGKLDELNDQLFAKHTDVFKGYTCEIVPGSDRKESPTLVVKNTTNQEKQLTIRPFTNIIQSGSNGEKIQLNSVIVYVDKNETFYLPTDLVRYLQ